MCFAMRNVIECETDGVAVRKSVSGEITEVSWMICSILYWLQ